MACGAAGTNDDGTGACSITGNGTVVHTYDGTSGHPNVFQGRLLNNTTVHWKVPVDSPPPNTVRIFRIRNVRADAWLIAGGNNLITGMVSIGTPGSVTIGNSQFNLADVQPEIIASGSTLPTLNRCVAANPGIAGDPTKPLDSGGQNGAQFTVTVTEGFPSAFLPKNIADDSSSRNLSARSKPKYS